MLHTTALKDARPITPFQCLVWALADARLHLCCADTASLSTMVQACAVCYKPHIANQVC